MVQRFNQAQREFIYRAIINNVAQRPVLVGNANLITTMSQIAPTKKVCSND
jgi:hypothetical protein